MFLLLLWLAMDDLDDHSRGSVEWELPLRRLLLFANAETANVNVKQQMMELE